MRLYCLLLIVTVFHVTAHAQTFGWAKSMGGAGGSYSFDWGTAITTDQSGNVYTIGNFVATTDFDPGPGIFNMTSTVLGSDMFI